MTRKTIFVCDFCSAEFSSVIDGTGVDGNFFKRDEIPSYTAVPLVNDYVTKHLCTRCCQGLKGMFAKKDTMDRAAEAQFYTAPAPRSFFIDPFQHQKS